MQLYHTSTHNDVTSRAIVDKLTPLLSKHSEEVALQIKQLHTLLEASTMTDPMLNQ
jgi:hypothetical protein